MNQPDKNLLKGIRIFFQAMYILLIIFFCIHLLIQGTFLLGNQDQSSTLSIVQAKQNPDITVNIEGNDVQPEIIMCMGAIMIKGVPLYLKISNAFAIIFALVVYILVLRTIRAIIRSVYQSEVFTIQNARRLKRIGFLLLADLVISYTMTMVNSISFETFDSSYIAAFIGMIIGDAFSYLISIAFIFFLASIFKIGINIQEENQSFV